MSVPSATAPGNAAVEYDDLADCHDVLGVESEPLCITLNSEGTRLGVGGVHGFRVFALRWYSSPCSEVGNSEKSCTRYRLEETQRFPVPSVLESLNRTDSSSSWALQEDDDEHQSQSSPSPAPPLTASASGVGVGVMALLLESSRVVVAGGGPDPIEPLNTAVIMDGCHVSRKVHFHDAIRQLAATSDFFVALTVSSIELVSWTGDARVSRPASGGPVASRPTPLIVQEDRRLVVYVSEPPPSALQGPNQATDAYLSSSASLAPSSSNVVDAATTVNFLSYSGGGGGTAPFIHSVSELPRVHSHSVMAMALNIDATLLATSSVRGTLLRVWDTATRVMMKELRVSSMGLSPVTSISFIGNYYLACICGSEVQMFFVGDESVVLSEKEQQIRFWATEDKRLATLPKNQVSRLHAMQFASSYFAAKYAVTACKIPMNRFTPSWITMRRAESAGHESSQRSTYAAVSSALRNTAVAAASTVAPSVTTTASNWIGYIGSFVPTYLGGSAPATSSGASPPLPTSSAAGADRPSYATYLPKTSEELTVLWWMNPVTRSLLQHSTKRRDMPQTHRTGNGTGVGSLDGDDDKEDIRQLFLVANADGQIISFVFDASSGVIEMDGDVCKPVSLHEV